MKIRDRNTTEKSIFGFLRRRPAFTTTKLDEKIGGSKSESGRSNEKKEMVEDDGITLEQRQHELMTTYQNNFKLLDENINIASNARKQF